MKLVPGILAALVLIACGGSAPGRTTTAEIANVDPSAAAGIRIAWVGHAVGDRATKVEARSMTAVVGAGTAQAVEVVTVEHREETREVLVAEGGELTKLAITYTKHRRTDTMQGTARDKPTPTLGKTYVVWREGGELEVTREDGSAPSAEEQTAVRKGNRSVGKPDAMETFIASRVWNLDEAVTLDAVQLAAIGELMSDDDVKPSAMTLTLVAADDATAAFALSFVMRGPTEDGGVLAFELAGKVVVERRTGRVQTIDLSGPFSGTAGKALIEIRGTISNKAVYTY